MPKVQDRNLFRIYLYAIFIIAFYIMSFLIIHYSLIAINQKFSENNAVPLIFGLELLLITPILQILGIIYQIRKKNKTNSNIIFDISNFLNFHVILILSSVIGSYIGFFSIVNIYSAATSMSQTDLQTIFATRYTLGVALIEILVYFTAIYTYYRKEYYAQFKYFIKNIVSSIFKILVYFILAVVLTLIFTSFGNLLTNLVGGNTAQTTANQENINNILSIDPGNISFLLTICLIGPIVEEYIFRFLLIEKILIPIFLFFKARKNDGKKFVHIRSFAKWSIVLIAAFTFALAHALSADSILNVLLDLFPYLGVSITLAYVYIRERNIYLTISIHMLNNIISIALLLFSLK